MSSFIDKNKLLTTLCNKKSPIEINLSLWEDEYSVWIAICLIYGNKLGEQDYIHINKIPKDDFYSSKGLEWQIVFNMISKYDGPELYRGSKESRMMVEERKRLLFVSMTRARDELIITGQFVSHGKRGEYTYNQFLEAAYECVGQHFSPEDVEKMRKERDEKKKAEKLLQKAKEEADNLSAKIDISSVS